MKTITFEDLDLSPEELKTLVEGAQQFMAPQEDPADEEVLTP